MKNKDQHKLHLWPLIAQELY